MVTHFNCSNLDFFLFSFLSFPFMSVFLFFHAYLPFLQLDQNLKISFCPIIAFTECNRNRNPLATFRVAPFFCFLSFYFLLTFCFLHLGRKTLKFCFPQTLQLLSSKFKCLGYFLPILRRIKPGLPVDAVLCLSFILL